MNYKKSDHIIVISWFLVPMPVIGSHPTSENSRKVINSSLDQSDKSVVQSIDFSTMIDPDALLPAEIARKRKQFAADFVGVKNLGIGKSVRKGNELGRGAFGAVSLGFSGDSTNADLIIKEGLSAEGLRDMKQEQNISDAFVGAVARKLGQKNPEYGKLIGMGAVIPVIGRTADGSIIQERAKGKDLSKAIFAGVAFDAFGYPKVLWEAVLRCAGAAQALATIHNAGFVHNDIKAQNIMILDDVAGNPCRLIDLGLMGKEGDAFQENCSANGAPEYVDRLYARQDCENSLRNARERYLGGAEELEKARQGIGDYADLSADEKQEIIEMYEGALGESEATVTELEERMKMLSSIPKMHSSYDIYSLASVLPILFFGREGSKFAKEMYWRTDAHPSEYVQLAQGENFDGEEYFLQKFTTMNKHMKDVAKKEYSESVLKRLAHLQAKMSSLDPNERPSAIDILEVFEDIGLADWSSGHYSIQQFHNFR